MQRIEVWEGEGRQRRQPPGRAGAQLIGPCDEAWVRGGTEITATCSTVPVRGVTVAVISVSWSLMSRIRAVP